MLFLNPSRPQGTRCGSYHTQGGEENVKVVVMMMTGKDGEKGEKPEDLKKDKMKRHEKNGGGQEEVKKMK
jgi:hypothetical protein